MHGDKVLHPSRIRFRVLAQGPADALAEEEPAIVDAAQDGVGEQRGVGVGLGAVDVKRMFSTSYTTKTNGSGVGLSISRSIVEAPGGRMWAIENQAGGATFSFVLPVSASEPRLEEISARQAASV